MSMGPFVGPIWLAVPCDVFHRAGISSASVEGRNELSHPERVKSSPSPRRVARLWGLVGPSMRVTILVGLVVLRASLRGRLATVHLAVSSQVRDDREVASAAFNFAGKGWSDVSKNAKPLECNYKRKLTYVSRQCGCTCESEESWVG